MNSVELWLWWALRRMGQLFWSAVDIWLSWGPSRERADLRVVCGG
jgi:hypothetical protein